MLDLSLSNRRGGGGGESSSSSGSTTTGSSSSRLFGEAAAAASSGFNFGLGLATAATAPTTTTSADDTTTGTTTATTANHRRTLTANVRDLVLAEGGLLPNVTSTSNSSTTTSTTTTTAADGESPRTREEERVRNDVRQLLARMQNILPFLMLFALRYVYKHAVGIVFVFAYTLLIIKLNQQLKQQVALKGDQDRNVLWAVVGVSFVGIVSACLLRAHVSEGEDGPMFALVHLPPQDPTLEEVLWAILASDLSVRLFMLALKALVALTPPSPCRALIPTTMPSPGGWFGWLLSSYFKGTKTKGRHHPHHHHHHHPNHSHHHSQSHTRPHRDRRTSATSRVEMAPSSTTTTRDLSSSPPALDTSSSSLSSSSSSSASSSAPLHTHTHTHHRDSSTATTTSITTSTAATAAGTGTTTTTRTMPLSLSTHTRKRRVYCLLEGLSLLVRSVLPIPAWMRFYQADSSYGDVFVFFYITLKCMVLARHSKSVGIILKHLCQTNTLEYGKAASLEELQEGGEGTKDCVICYETLSPQHAVVLPCAHFFCEECLMEWCVRERSCPLCRTTITSNFDTGLVGQSRSGSTSAWPCVL